MGGLSRIHVQNYRALADVADDRFLILVDDLEAGRSDSAQEIFDRYRLALDTILTERKSRRASVHFLVNMLEAYYFATAGPSIQSNAMRWWVRGPER